MIRFNDERNVPSNSCQFGQPISTKFPLPKSQWASHSIKHKILVIKDRCMIFILASAKVNFSYIRLKLISKVSFIPTLLRTAE